MIPHTLVLKPGLMVHSVYNGYWFWGRPSFSELWQDLRAATREIRPDWDLSAPGLREEWEAGDFSHFHGWDRQVARARCRPRTSSRARDDRSAHTGVRIARDRTADRAGPHGRGSRLAAAVSNAGALGMLTLTWSDDVGAVVRETA